MRILSIIIGMLLVIPASGHSVAPPHVLVGGHVKKPGRINMLKKPESIAQLIARVGGIPVTALAAKNYAAGKMVHAVDIVFYRGGKQVVLRFGRDDDYMRKTLIKQLDAFSVRRLSSIEGLEYDHFIRVKPKK